MKLLALLVGTTLIGGVVHQGMQLVEVDPIPQTDQPVSTPEPAPPAHPLEISTLRSREYPGSQLTIEGELSPGTGFRRYIASYDSDGLKQFGLLSIPVGEKPESGWPAIIFNHGWIRPSEHKTEAKYVAYQAGFASNGYIVFKPDYRGHGESEGIARGGYSSPDYTIDVLNALSSIKIHPDVDPNRIGMWGHSMGGQITLKSMVVSPDIKAGVIWAGVVADYPNILTNWRRGPGYSEIIKRSTWRQEFLESYGSPTGNPDFWDDISPNRYVSDISGPVQLHHATGDESVPYDFSELLAEEMEAENQEVELYIYQGDNHNISANFSSAINRSLEFFDQHVKGV